MKKMIIPSMIFFTALYAEGRPEVSICKPEKLQQEEFQNAEEKVRAWTQASKELLARLCHNDATVLKNYDLLSSELDTLYRKGKSLKIEEVHSIFRAIDFAAEKHRLQMRKNKEKTPYICHPLGVAYYLIHYGEVNDTALIIAALLHDTVEETQTTFEEIEAHFGKEVASYVGEMTDDKTLSSFEKRRQQVISASKKSKSAAQIHLADKLYNALDLLDNPPEGWSRLRIDRYFQWMQAVIDRLPEANDKLKNQTQKIINTYWENQKK